MITPQVGGAAAGGPEPEPILRSTAGAAGVRVLFEDLLDDLLAARVPSPEGWARGRRFPAIKG